MRAVWLKRTHHSIAALRASYLATADQYITVFRELTHTLYGRDIPYVLLMHIGAFDAKMLPDLIGLFRKRGFTFMTLPEAMKDPVYREDPDIGIEIWRSISGAGRRDSPCQIPAKL